jgi:arylsulfatase A-like enzyme
LTSCPDILLLVLDTQRVDRLSCYGYGRETSPFLDTLAQDATRFEYAFSTAQWTVPSHASMFTGLYPGSHQMLHASSVLPETLIPVAQSLHQRGYFTAAFCNNPLIGVVNTGLQRGFQSFLNYGGLMTSRPNQTAAQLDLLDRYRWHFKRVLARTLTALQDAFARSDALLDLSFSPLMVPLWQTALRFKGNTAQALRDASKLHIERQGVAPERPIFSFVNLMGTHMPYHPPARYIARFAPWIAQDKTAQRYLRQFNSDVFGWLAPLTDAMSEEHKATLDALYDAEVAYQDELVGAFLQRLRASGALDHTLLIICADHGEHLGEKQLMGHSISLYNELVHVPLIIRDPDGDLPRGSTIETVVSTRRIFHTILTAARCATEDEQALTLAQSSNGTNRHEPIFATGVTPQNLLHLMQRRQPELILQRRCDLPRYALWHEQYKLIQTGDELELYDTFEDPDEEVNLSDIIPERAEMLQTSLLQFIQSVNSTQEAPASGLPLEEYNDPLVSRRLHDLGYLE